MELEVEQLRAELAALREQEPVAWMHPDSGICFEAGRLSDLRAHNGAPGKAIASGFTVPLYKAPQPTPEPLTPKGETVPQTVENLQAIMARDAAEMLRMKEEISKLTQKLNQARQRQRPIPEGYVLVPVEPTRELISAMACSVARDDEGEFLPLMDLIDFSGENKTHTVLRAAYKAMLAAKEPSNA